MAETKAKGNGAGQPKPTNAEAIRQGLGKLGRDAKPADIQKYARDTYGLDIPIKQIYNRLSEARKKAGKKGKAKPKAQNQAAPAPAAARQMPASPTRPAAAPKTPTGGIDLKDIAAAKGLLERVGPAKLRGLIDLLAR